MKRWLSILAVLGCIVALSGCKNENGAEQAYFNAKVLEVNKEYVDVRCIEAFNSGISVDEEFSVTKDVVSAGGAPELNVDDNIRVVFNGDVMESDPLQIGTVYAIYLLENSQLQRRQIQENLGHIQRNYLLSQQFLKVLLQSPITQS